MTKIKVMATFNRKDKKYGPYDYHRRYAVEIEVNGWLWRTISRDLLFVRFDGVTIMYGRSYKNWEEFESVWGNIRILDVEA